MELNWSIRKEKCSRKAGRVGLQNSLMLRKKIHIKSTIILINFHYSDDKLEETINEIINKFDIPMTDRVEILVGKDTRPSSPSLAKCVMDGVLALSGKPIDYGIVTTPQLHYFVACKNSRHEYGVPTEEGYYNKLITAFKKLNEGTEKKGNYVNRVLYDGANGVGARKIKYFQERLAGLLDIELFNDAVIGTGKLNYLVRFLCYLITILFAYERVVSLQFICFWGKGCFCYGLFLSDIDCPDLLL